LKSTLKSFIMPTNNQNPPIHTEPRMTRSSSLRRANSLRRTNNKTQAQQASQNQGTPLTRSGTGGSLERNSRRTTFSGNRKYKSRDLNVTVSRGIQTNLTKDPMEDLPNNNIQTKLNFHTYLPDVIRDANDDVETHIVEPLEPPDVRKSRQLTLDNMKLHRELEKMKQGAFEHETLKKELRHIKGKWEEDKKIKSKLEDKLQYQHTKILEIATTLEQFEQEFQIKDATILKLDMELRHQKCVIHQLSKRIQQDQDIIEEKQNQILKLQKDIQNQQKLQDEKELHEFLHTENLALTETLADAEIENERLKEIIEKKDIELSNSEEQCRHLVRVNEQRHQEVLSAKTKAKSLETKAKNMILQQALAVEKVISYLTEKPLQAKEIDELETKTMLAIEENLGFVSETALQIPDEDNLSYDQSLEYLSLSIQNRLKVEADQNVDCQNNNSLLERLSKLNSLMNDFRQKIEE